MVCPALPVLAVPIGLFFIFVAYRYPGRIRCKRSPRRSRKIRKPWTKSARKAAGNEGDGELISHILNVKFHSGSGSI